MRVLVTGGAGYIGSHTVLALLERGDDVIVVDDFANSSPVALERVARLAGRSARLHRLDVADEEALDAVFATERPEAVIHFAGLKAVGESVADPLRYYAMNLGTTFALLAVMRRHDVRTLVFSSSATVYGEHQHAPYREDGGILNATNPYGQTKVMIERILTDVAQADPRWRIALLRYFNPIGAHQSGLIGEDPRGVPNNLAPYIAQVAVGRLAEVGVFGDDYPTADGTGERDYIHVLDLADGHVAALEHLRTQTGVRAWNLGTGRATSVLALIAAFEKAVGRPIPHRVLPRRDGDLAQAWADATRAADELGWTAQRDIAEMAEDSWRWQSGNPQGYDAR